MRLIRGFRNLSGADRLLIIRLLFYIIRAEIILGLFPYSSERRLVFGDSMKTIGHKVVSTDILKKYLGLLKKVIRHLPWNPSCLRQAAAIRDLLVAEGFEAKIRIGMVASQGKYIAHAWVECGGIEVLKTGPYNLLVPIDGGKQ